MSCGCVGVFVALGFPAWRLQKEFRVVWKVFGDRRRHFHPPAACTASATTPAPPVALCGRAGWCLPRTHGRQNTMSWRGRGDVRIAATYGCPDIEVVVSHGDCQAVGSRGQASAVGPMLNCPSCMATDHRAVATTINDDLFQVLGASTAWHLCETGPGLCWEAATPDECASW